jgi:hypothetical protein
MNGVVGQGIDWPAPSLFFSLKRISKIISCLIILLPLADTRDSFLVWRIILAFSRLSSSINPAFRLNSFAFHGLIQGLVPSSDEFLW